MTDAATKSAPTRMPAGALASQVGSRLCHDLISPLGAIGNGVELLQLSDAYPGIANSPELQLIAEAVASARTRIQAFRMAFGQSTGDQRVARAELARLLDGMSGSGRLKMALEADGDFARTEIRMVLLGLMCMETAFPWGGRVMVIRAGNGWRLVAEADRAKPDPALWAWLGGGAQPSATMPAQVHFPLLAEIAATEHRALRWEVDETGAEIAF